MTRIDFYILPEGTAPALVPTVCKLCDKAVQAAGEPSGAIYLHVPDRALATALDTALWTFRQGSFLSHERLGDGPVEEPLPIVLLGNGEPPAGYHGVMINLGSEIPSFFSRFERVLEIVDGDAAARSASRARYKFYRDRGYELNTHTL